jgi:hypothetical protein
LESIWEDRHCRSWTFNFIQTDKFQQVKDIASFYFKPAFLKRFFVLILFSQDLWKLLTQNLLQIISYIDVITPCKFLHTKHYFISALCKGFGFFKLHNIHLSCVKVYAIGIWFYIRKQSRKVYLHRVITLKNSFFFSVAVSKP